MQKLRITQSNNGYILEGDGRQIVIEEREPMPEDIEMNPEFAEMKFDEAGEKLALRNLFQQIAEYFGIFRDKYSKFNLKISFDDPGRGVEIG